MKISKMFYAIAAAMPLVALPGVAQAQGAAGDASATSDEAAKPLDISVEVGALSDYRFRGLSLSGKKPELTAQISVAHQSGAYASLWVSNVDLGLGGADDMEMDWTAGLSKSVGKVNLDGGVIYYSYLKHSDLNYFEAYGSIGTDVGPGSVKVGVAYAPKQDNIGGRDNTYVYVSGEVPLGKSLPITLHGSFGYENGAFGTHKKDWLVGASFDLGGGLSASLDYVDTAHSLTSAGDPTAVAALKFDF